MKALVTGGCGFIGSHLVDTLIEQGCRVTVIDNLVTGTKDNCNNKAHYIFSDVESAISSNREEVEDVDVIFHLAAMPRIQPSFEKPLYTYRNNALGTAAICDFARSINAKVVYAGSSTFYGGIYLNPYAFSKWAGEEVCKMYSEVYGLTTAVARFFNVYGPRHLKEGSFSTIIGIFEQQYENGKPFTITGDGEQRRDFAHVKDICSGLIAISRGDYKGEVFNLGTGKNYSINELASMYPDASIKYIPGRVGEAKETLADISKAQEKAGWRAEHTLEDYVKDFVQAVKGGLWRYY